MDRSHPADYRQSRFEQDRKNPSGSQDMHDASLVYADYQATTPVDPRVIKAMAPFWHDTFGNPHSAEHAVGWQAARAVHEAAADVGALIDADAEEIIFTSGATEANNLALFGLAMGAPPTKNRLLISAIEHKCVLAAAHALAERHGFVVETLSVDHHGFVNPEALKRVLADDVLLASIMLVNNEVGTIQSIAELGSILAEYDIPLHCDAAQAPCAMEMSGLADHADLISLSGHKIYGPQGIGALFVRHALQDRMTPLIHGGGQQGGLRSGTVPVALCVGMGAAAQLVSGETACAERNRIAGLRDKFFELLRENGADATLNGPPTQARHPGNANLCFTGHDGRDLIDRLQPHLAVSTGAACTSGIAESSHVLRALGQSTGAIDASIRFSFGRFTSDEDIEQAATLILDVLNR